MCPEMNGHMLIYLKPVECGQENETKQEKALQV